MAGLQFLLGQGSPVFAEDAVEGWGEVIREPQIQFVRMSRLAFRCSRVVEVVHGSSSFFGGCIPSVDGIGDGFRVGVVVPSEAVAGNVDELLGHLPRLVALLG